MGVSDLTGVFSRYFVVGFFVPCFFGLVVAALGLPDGWLPQPYATLSAEGKVLALAGAAALAALVLLGLNVPLSERLRGETLEEKRLVRPLKYIYKWTIGWQRRRRGRLISRQSEHEATSEENDDQGPANDEQAEADTEAWELSERFPRDSTRLLPTALGNAERAALDESFYVWGVDSLAVWARIEPMLGSAERELHADARSDRDFFVNSSLISLLVGALLVVSHALEATFGRAFILGFALIVLAHMLYRAAVGAAIRWGRRLKASIDLHRLELYRMLGVRDPQSFTEERDVLSLHVNRCLLYGAPIPDELRASAPGAGAPSDLDARGLQSSMKGGPE